MSEHQARYVRDMERCARVAEGHLVERRTEEATAWINLAKLYGAMANAPSQLLEEAAQPRQTERVRGNGRPMNAPPVSPGMGRPYPVPVESAYGADDMTHVPGQPGANLYAVPAVPSSGAPQHRGQ